MSKNTLLNKIENFILTNHLAAKNNPVLLAVSGGVDSMVMSRLFFDAGFRFGMAHCHFGLRGKDADEDQQLVKKIAEQYQVPFFTVQFNTLEFAQEKGISVEMAARELRYQWLEEIRKSNGFHAIATAHHRDDNIETVLLNLVKGTGIAGLHGILPKRDKIIRPLLIISREEIESFAETGKLEFREDHTNRESVFQRNRLRNEVLPQLEIINPSFRDTFTKNIEKFRDTEAVYRKGLEYFSRKLLQKRGDDFYISIKKIRMYEGAKTILYELLKPFDFGEPQSAQVFDGLESESGNQYFSSTHRVVKSRNFLIITGLHEESAGIVLTENIKKPVKLRGGEIRFHLVTGANINPSEKDKNGSVDFSKLEFPLVWRRWKKGDYFYPLGMKKKKKKLSDFFTDIKLSLPEKERVWLLESAGKIVWIVGYRVDERFKVTEKTKETLILKWRPV